MSNVINLWYTYDNRLPVPEHTMMVYALVVLLLVSDLCAHVYGAIPIPEVPKAKLRRVCLNMIVKNEEKTIQRSLVSAAPYYHEAYITDTGSEDGTIKKIEDTLKVVNRTGTMSFYKWKDDFAAARNYALAQIPKHCEYILILDADAEVKPQMDETNLKLGYRKKLKADAYHIQCDVGTQLFPRMILIKNTGQWQWGGVRHEVLVSQTPVGAPETLSDFVVYYHQDSPRGRDPMKFVGDAKALLREHKRKPDCTRTVFYLAESYKNSGQKAKAAKYYKLRDSMGGWVEERSESLMALGKLYEELGEREGEIVWAYSKSAMINPMRVEALQRLSAYFRSKNKFAEAYIVSIIGMMHLKSPYPILGPVNQAYPPRPQETRLFINKWVYDYGMEMEASSVIHKMGFFDEGIELAKNLTLRRDLLGDQGDAAAAKNNLRLFELAWNQPALFANEFTKNRKRLHTLLCLLPLLSEFAERDSDDAFPEDFSLESV